MESWRSVWRKGFAPLLSREALEALRIALANDDARLIQGCTTSPPPLLCVQDWPCEGACVIGYAGASEMGGLFPRNQVIEQGYPCATVGEVEAFFARMCFEADQLMGEPAAMRWFLNWVDDTPRDEMRRELLPEVVLALAGRESDAQSAAGPDRDCPVGVDSDVRTG